MNELCGICGKPVLPEDGRHGATGDHWDCTKPARDFLSELERAPAGGAIGCYIAKGGSKVHLKRAGLNTSLCGHTPLDTARKMRSRGGWWVCRFGPNDPLPTSMRRCEPCYAAFSG